jgi:hypothetical protein
MGNPREVRGRSYTRIVPSITVEFICQRCQRPQVYTMYPGPRPKGCMACFPEVRKEQARARKRRQRSQRKPVVAPKQRDNGH